MIRLAARPEINYDCKTRRSLVLEATGGVLLTRNYASKQCLLTIGIQLV